MRLQVLGLSRGIPFGFFLGCVVEELGKADARGFRLLGGFVEVILLGFLFFGEFAGGGFSGGKGLLEVSYCRG